LIFMCFQLIEVKFLHVDYPFTDFRVIETPTFTTIVSCLILKEVF